MVTSLTYKNECHLGINKILNLFKVVRVACFMYIHFEQLIFIKCTIEFFFSVRLSHQDFIYKCVFVCVCVDVCICKHQLYFSRLVTSTIGLSTLLNLNWVSIRAFLAKLLFWYGMREDINYLLSPLFMLPLLRRAIWQIKAGRLIHRIVRVHGSSS